MNEHLPTFAGFAPPTEHYFPMPNDWINICAQITSLAELKVLIYIARHTWGYHEYDIAKHITLDEFMRGRKRRDGSRMDAGTGLARKSVIRGLQRAIADGYLICEIDESDKGRVRKSYKLKMRAGDAVADGTAASHSENGATPLIPVEVSKKHSRGQESTPQRCSIDTPEVKNVDHRGSQLLPQRSRM